MDANEFEVREEVPASRKLGRKDAGALAAAVSRVIVSKGGKVCEFKPGAKPAADVLAAMLGPTGNLRAPTLRRGKTLLVGFNQEAYEKALL